MAFFIGCRSLDGYAAEVEIMGIFGNDSLFDSDGSGVTGSFELVSKIDQWRVGGGIYVVTPELMKEKRPNDDPLAELSRLTCWIGKTSTWRDQTEIHFSGRVGIEGGVADDIGFHLQDVAHDLINKGSRDLTSTNETKGIAGISGWLRTTLVFGRLGASVFNLTPYAHASLGSDTVEGGGGVIVAIQPKREAAPLPLWLPKNGSYAPDFGGDGIGLFAGCRGVAHESFYDGLQNPFVGEVGLIGQATLFNSLSLGVGGSCTTEPYEGSIGSECKTDLRLSYKWPSRKQSGKK